MSRALAVLFLVSLSGCGEPEVGLLAEPRPRITCPREHSGVQLKSFKLDPSFKQEYDCVYEAPSGFRDD